MDINTSKILIRQATLRDLDILVQFRIELFREMGRIQTDSDELTLKNACEQYFTATIPQRKFLSWILEINGKIIAVSGLIFLQRPPSVNNPSGKEAYIMNMYTLPEWRKKGLGANLLKEIINYVRKKNISLIRLHATEEGRGIYEKNGFILPTEPEMVLDFSK
ncbi:MAG: GNAT family N-acetyltransferase [Promethearchaeota archaeon]